MGLPVKQIKKFNEVDHSMALRQINALVLHEIYARAQSLGSMIKKHGGVEGMVIQLLCFHRLLVLQLAACSAAELR